MSFSLSGTWSDSSGGDHVFTMSGTFQAADYDALLTESISILGAPICTLNWVITGSKIQ